MSEEQPTTHHTSRITDHTTVCVVGLGYVGLPLLEAFANHFRVVGFDVDEAVVDRVNRTNGNRDMVVTRDPAEIGRADYIIIAVPTPVTRSKEPDLSYLKGAAKITGQHMKRGSTVVLESTVYPGVTEEVMKPILEKESGFECGRDFKIAYSPERINPGDREHTVETIVKVVAGMDEETTGRVADLYSRVAPQVYRARDIKTAEAAKVIENVQRDLNIALVNELSVIFHKMGLNTGAVLDAASTKWNFHRYSPGLVGGHCIPVDPYYLVHKAEELGYHPQVILAGRAINDSMPKHVAELAVKALNDAGKVIKGSRVLIMGLTYKENVADTRETPVKGIIKELLDYGVDIYGCDPLLNDIEHEFGIRSCDASLLVHGTNSAKSMNSTNSMNSINPVDCIIIAVAHDEFRSMALDQLKTIMNDNPVLVDVRGLFAEREATERGIRYRTL